MRVAGPKNTRFLTRVSGSETADLWVCGAAVDNGEFMRSMRNPTEMTVRALKSVPLSVAVDLWKAGEANLSVTCLCGDVDREDVPFLVVTLSQELGELLSQYRGVVHLKGYVEERVKAFVEERRGLS